MGNSSTADGVLPHAEKWLNKNKGKQNITLTVVNFTASHFHWPDPESIEWDNYFGLWNLHNPIGGNIAAGFK